MLRPAAVRSELTAKLLRISFPKLARFVCADVSTQKTTVSPTRPSRVAIMCARIININIRIILAVRSKIGMATVMLIYARKTQKTINTRRTQNSHWNEQSVTDVYFGCYSRLLYTGTRRKSNKPNNTSQSPEYCINTTVMKNITVVNIFGNFLFSQFFTDLKNFQKI